MLFADIQKDKIGATLKQAIKDTYGSIQEYANYTMQSSKSIYNWENDKGRLPYLTDFVCNCRLLNLSVDYLCYYARNDIPIQDTCSTINSDNSLNGKLKPPTTKDYIPSIHFEDVILLIPFLSFRDLEILLRLMDNCRSDYLILQVKPILEKITKKDAGKYVIHMLNSKLSPLSNHFPDQINNDKELLKKCEADYYIEIEKFQNRIRKYISLWSEISILTCEE